MNTLIVTNQVAHWPRYAPRTQAVSAHAYLTDPRYRGQARVINLCHPLNYQSLGYYVSLLAQARGHLPLPDVKTIEDLHAAGTARLLTDRLDREIQCALAAIDAPSYALTLYFGSDAQHVFGELGAEIFALLPAPLLRIGFVRSATACGRWQTTQVQSLPPDALTADQHVRLLDAAADYSSRRSAPIERPVRHARNARQPALAILYDPDSQESPSNAPAIDKFQNAARALDMRADIITRDDADRLAEFDALFIRDTTSIQHYTYDLARQAALDGLVVMDDPDSIIQCTNKVYLAELFRHHGIPTPASMIVHRKNIDCVIPALGLPCILKQPDGAFSIGVVKIHSTQQLQETAAQFLQQSELILAQEYLPTAFDWRVGIVDRRPLFACKYFMAPDHWQIIKRQQEVKLCEGQTSAVPLSQVPQFVLDTAQAAADLIGDGFYGVDLKQVGKRCYLIEVNDNPNVDFGNEDSVLQDALYRQVMWVFRRRIDCVSGRRP